MNALKIAKRDHHAFILGPLLSGNLFNHVDDVACGIRPSQASRGTRLAFDFPGLVEERENFGAEALGGEFRFWNHAACAGARHLLGVAQLVAVGGVPDGYEDSGASGSGNFRRGDGPCAANDHIRPGETFRHVGEKGHDLRWKFAPRVRGAHRIIIAFAGLMHDDQFAFSCGESIHGVDNRAIDHEGALAATGDKEAKWFLRLSWRDREKLSTHWTASDYRFFAPRACRNVIPGGNALGDSREHSIGESRLRVRLENHVGHATQPSGQHHRTCRIAAYSKSGDWLMFAQDGERVGKPGAKHGEI